MAYLHRAHPPPGRPAGAVDAVKVPRLTLLPWEYFWIGFNKFNFPDLFDPLWIGSGVLLLVLVALYSPTRALHRHRRYLDMWEWLFWTGLITLLPAHRGVGFQFDFAVIMVILASGLASWPGRASDAPAAVRAYEHQLARQRYLARARSSATRRRRSGPSAVARQAAQAALTPPPGPA